MKHFEMPKPPYLGAAYYPEDWDDDQIDVDVAKMVELGLKVVRIGEFAWHRMEPKPGEFDFTFFHKVIDKLKAAGIAVIMGTPTATPPRWLSAMYPHVFRENADGREAAHGGRRHCCSNNPDYVRYCLRIVDEMAREFADEEAIIGWQIDNEIYEGGDGCFCPCCRSGFSEYLRGRYGDIDALNRAWNLNLFSQWYDSFEEVPQPRDAWHNPHLRFEYRTYQNDSHVQFVHKQAEVLKKYVKVPIGTDTMPFGAMDYRDMTSTLDVVQFNHYNTQQNLWHVALWFDFLRTLKDRPMWNTETSTCWNGSAEINQSVKPEGFCRVNSWMPIALGGEANMYWLWRTHWAGHELMHGAVLDASGRPMHTAGEVKQIAADYEKAADFINGTRVKSEVAMHFTARNWRIMDTQHVVKSLNYMDTLNDSFYKPLIDCGVRPDVIDAKQPLDAYKLIVSPLMMTIQEGDLPARIMQWVKDGGTWIAGPLTDVRNEIGARFKDRPLGILEELTGAHWDYSVPDIDGHMSAHWQDGSAFGSRLWYELYDEKNADVLARVTAPHSALDEKPVLLRFSVGNGRVYILGTIPAHDDMQRLIRIAAGNAGVALNEPEGSVLGTPRQGNGMSGLILLEYAGSPAAYTLPSPMTDILTGEKLEGRIELKPYDVKVLKA